ncbi:MAG: sodium:calcium antiporter [Zetaproteobacteria bacterium]|nr:MAG: sodium:calcium antiporter [Zetaproteobacteria bacterium]
MWDSLALLITALVLVFVAAQAFTNALEFIGERFGVSEGVTGSIFAAVGTAMPETIVPVVAILAGGAAQHVNEAVGMGAILGAPFMLATLSLGIMGIFAARKRGWVNKLQPEVSGLKRDIITFLCAFLLVALAAFVPGTWPHAHVLIAIILFIIYFFYVLATIKASASLVDSGHATEADNPLYLSYILPEYVWTAVIQLLAGLAVLVWGARLFVDGAEQLSQILGVSTLVVSLLVVPIATELPEKVNSVIWIRRGRDTLAFGNITGAMVFQGTMIPAIGMLLMPWRFEEVFAGLAVALAFTGIIWLGLLLYRGHLSPIGLCGNAFLYLLFVVAVVFAA